MPSPEILAVALMLAAAQPASAESSPLPPEAGDAVPAEAVQRTLLDQTYVYFRLKDGGSYDRAYAMLAPAMRAYLTRDLYRSQAASFNAGAGKVEGRQVTKLSWYRDPADAPAPGLYVAADFVSKFPNIRLHCGYVMWRREPDGSFRIVREEQSFIDEQTAGQMTPERLETLPRQLGCVR